jgi:hypothetical protein
MALTEGATRPASAPAGDGGLHNVSNLLTTGTYRDTSGAYCTIYPDAYPMVWPHWPTIYPFIYPVPGGTTVMQTGINNPSAEKPHEVVQRAIREIAQAAHALQQSAEAMGVPVDERALEEAIVAKVREAL